MGSITVGVVGSKDYAKNIGKKGTSSDITLYNMKSGDNVVTAIEPSSYPEKLSSLFYATSMSDFVVFAVSALDADFAESLMMIDALDKREGFFVTEDRERVAGFVRGTSAEGFTLMPNDPISLREALLGMAERQSEVKESGGAVVIDHFFKVKGVGTVVLGIVSSGCIKKHDELTLYPSKKRVQIRSIQKQDVDYDSACLGDRVGLALRGVEPDEIERGYVLSSGDISCVSEISAELEKNRFYKRDLGGTVHVGCGMQFLPAQVRNFEGNRVSLEFERPLALYGRAILCDLNAPKPRVIGKLIV
jgi:selenocysteine-specific translation elongation factor